MPRKAPKSQVAKFYVVPKMVKLADLRDISKRVAKNTTMSPQEVEMVLNSFVEELQTMLLDSYSVRLGDWASFRVTVNSAGSDTKKDCTPLLIKRVNVRCMFSDEFKERMQHAEWVDAGKVHTTDPQ
ncbi:MAG: HU family DNA-binding protein [Bacteroidaceae bacterium]|nr:HU family DNA-binding protein [Bacteroidaceae bacterium]